jgi:hypothetical protein
MIAERELVRVRALSGSWRGRMAIETAYVAMTARFIHSRC